jgi:hypothetical protein
MNHLGPTLKICALHPSFLNKFTLIWHHAFAPCAQFFAVSPRFWVRSMFYAMSPTFMKSTPKVSENEQALILLNISLPDAYSFFFWR